VGEAAHRVDGMITALILSVFGVASFSQLVCSVTMWDGERRHDVPNPYTKAAHFSGHLPKSLET
jgi:hypothetical protein